jgi:hypothetical protein
MATVAHWTEAQLAGPTWQPLGWPMPSRARVAHARRAVTTRCPAIAHGAVRCSPACRRLNDDDVFTSAILVGPSRSRNMNNWRMEVGIGSSQVRRTAWQQPKVSAAETSPRLEKELLSQFLSCKEVAQTLGHALSVMGSNGERAHWWRRKSPV